MGLIYLFYHSGDGISRKYMNKPALALTRYTAIQSQFQCHCHTANGFDDSKVLHTNNDSQGIFLKVKA